MAVKKKIINIRVYFDGDQDLSLIHIFTRRMQREKSMLSSAKRRKQRTVIR